MKDNDFISKRKFMEELRRYQKGSVTRRHFLGVTGLGAATAVLGSAMPGLPKTPSAEVIRRPPRRVLR